MGHIIVLDETTANQIAAGEVVERPASIVKELVENAIDAGATHIAVDIRGGGIPYIRITDNGSGIEADDVLLAFERHATSKIKRAEDLFSITTLGFRGEALASIAAVSNLELTTRTKDSEVGSFVKISGGKLIEHTQVGCPIGTTFVIRDLFFNTPARYKFLKKDTTEATYVADMLSRIALARTDISFKLTGAFANRNEVFHTPGNNDLKSAVYNVFGRAFSMNTRDVNFEKDGIAITGIAGTPEMARANRNAQIVFLNQRYIKSRLISSAADEAYKTFLMKNKFPFFVINIQMSPTLFDVNVHPSKLDVRFSNEGQLFSAIYHALNNAIQTHQEIRAPLETPLVQPIPKPEPIVTPTIAPKPLELELEVHPVTYEQETFTPSTPVVARETQAPQVISEHAELLESTYVGQLFNTYLVFQQSERLFLIDQHAAHERIKYEEVREAYANSQLSSQPLLVPQIIHLSTPDLAVYHENESTFVTLGFEIEPFGGNSLAIRQVPSELEGSQIEEAFSALLNRFAHANQAVKTVDDELLYIIACKAAIKGNQRIDATAANQLLHALLAMKNPLSCPHGRPTILRVDRRDFEKLFKRIV